MKSFLPIVLFPVRFLGGLLWALWSLGRREYYLPRAPIFGGGTDQFVIYLKKLSRGRYGVLLYDLAEQRTEVVFESVTPIRLFGLQPPDELVLCQRFEDGGCLCTVINLGARKGRSPIQHTFPGLLLNDSLLPKTLGLLSYETVCSDDDCFTEFRLSTLNGSYSIGHRIPGRIESGPSISLNENIIAYSDGTNIHVSCLPTGEQVTHPLPQTFVCNWSLRNVLLGFSRTMRCLYLINNETQEVRSIEVPIKGIVQHGVISPSGAKIAYWIVTKIPQGSQGTSLFVYSVAENSHTLVAERAKILDVRWGQLERSLSLSGVRRRDLFDVAWGYKMRNAMVCDKEVIYLDRPHVLNLT